MKYLYILLISMFLFPEISWSTNNGGVYRICKATGSSAVAISCNPQDQARIIAVSVHFSTAPTTAGSLTIMLNSVQGSTYDTVLFEIDPSVTAATSLVWNPCFLGLISGDTVDITYANADGRTYGIIVYYEL